ncbi:Ring-h2 finger protein atl32 [Thalictrum thalictroides]|uniref:Ring-h2 finger protein atl32 n=1 Tax=Thalictrum thalictroides TaxID=46969 RepID=A0A7J6WW17_THATH|nr:Ring-h2 finger protein atl32 [Thalictrum thalictroides]
MSSKSVGVATQIMVLEIVISVVLLLVGIGVLVLIHICIVGRAFRRGFNVGNSMIVARRENICNSMSHDDVEKLPCFAYRAEEKVSSSSADCAVCLENFRMGDKCRLLPICKHSFHAECVDSWLLKAPICPICRTNASTHKNSMALSGEEDSHFNDLRLQPRERQPVINETELSANISPMHNHPLESAV